MVRCATLPEEEDGIPSRRPRPTHEEIVALIEQMIEEGVIWEDEDGGLYLTPRGYIELHRPGLN